ncbi:RHS repeat-associated core domain-containing protein [Nostoc sp. CHAB 5824]|nr:RHS repeat-associated core domain-containing protein [Nostoc sp. CHAB 5824]
MWDAPGGVSHLLGTNRIVQAVAMWEAWGRGDSHGTLTEAQATYGGQWGYLKDSETGLLLLGHRYYDPTTGRFINRDPIGYEGGINLYAYTENDPVNLTDPTGFSAFSSADEGLALMTSVLGGGATNAALGAAGAYARGECYSWEDGKRDFALGAIPVGVVGIAGKGLQYLYRGRTLYFHGSSVFNPSLIKDGHRHWATIKEKLGKGAGAIGGNWNLSKSFPFVTNKSLGQTSQVPSEVSALYRRAFSPNLFSWWKGIQGQYYFQQFGWGRMRLAVSEGAGSVIAVRGWWEFYRTFFP